MPGKVDPSRLKSPVMPGNVDPSRLKPPVMPGKVDARLFYSAQRMATDGNRLTFSVPGLRKETNSNSPQ